jgi:hypothetical protein
MLHRRTEMLYGKRLATATSAAIIELLLLLMLLLLLLYCD